MIEREEIMSASDRIDRGRQLVPAQRRQLIAEQIRDTGSVSVADLEARFGISPMTARRDLPSSRARRAGRAARTAARWRRPWHGTRTPSRSRLAEAAEAKQALGIAAAALIGDGETVFVDCSTTAYYAVRSLIDVRARRPRCSPRRCR